MGEIAMNDIIKDLNTIKDAFSNYKKAVDGLKPEDLENLRSYIKYNQKLSHCEDSSFLVRSFADELHDSQEIEDIVGEVEFMIDEVKDFLGSEE